jgi:hypothetical protein
MTPASIFYITAAHAKGIKSNILYRNILQAIIRPEGPKNTGVISKVLIGLNPVIYRIFGNTIRQTPIKRAITCFLYMVLLITMAFNRTDIVVRFRTWE